MAAKIQRIQVGLPDDLHRLLVEDAKKHLMPVATRLVQIIDLYYTVRNRKKK
jgi:hypothetical protein